MNPRRAIRWLAGLSACAGLLTALRSPAGKWGGALWLPKLWAASWQPWLGALGAAAAFPGLRGRDPGTVVAGTLGALIGAAYTREMARPRDPFTPVFGAGWERRIPPALRSRLPRRRFALLQPRPPRALCQRNIPIGSNALLCDIWEPQPGVPRTGLAVLYLHGGLWQALDKGFLVQPLFDRLAAEGHVVLDLAYSLSPGAGLPQMLSEVAQSVRWLRQHAADLAVHPERIVLMGVSGGAHLALLAAYAPEPEAEVRAVVSISGITDLPAFYQEYGRTNPRQPEYSREISEDLRPRLHDRNWLERLLTRMHVFPAYRHANLPGGALLLIYLLGGTLKEIPEVYREYSPLAHVSPGCPPTLLIHAGDDFVVDPSHGRKLRRALEQEGVPSVHIELPRAVHGFDQYFGVSRRIAPAAQTTAYDLDRFLALMV